MRAQEASLRTFLRAFSFFDLLHVEHTDMRIGYLDLVMVVGLGLCGACGDDDADDASHDDGDHGHTAAGSGGAGGKSASGSGGSGSGGSSSSSADCTATISLLDFKLDPKVIEAESGEITLCAQNDGDTPHDLGVRDSSKTTLGKTKTLNPGESDRFTVTLDAATYDIYCSLGGHESLGMKGTLTVK